MKPLIDRLRDLVAAFSTKGPDWDALDDLAEDMRAAAPDDALELIRLFEAIPTTESHYLWDVMHFLETVPGYEKAVLASLKRAPSRFPMLMARRMVNSGKRVIAGNDMVALLRSIASSAPHSISSEAEKVLVGVDNEPAPNVSLRGTATKKEASAPKRAARKKTRPSKKNRKKF